MTSRDLTKNETIHSVVDHLANKFGGDSFRITDHWDGDLCAIGISDNSGKYLIYISTYRKEKDHYFVSLENLMDNGSLPEIAGEYDKITLQQLEEYFAAHLRIAGRS